MKVEGRRTDPTIKVDGTKYAVKHGRVALKKKRFAQGVDESLQEVTMRITHKTTESSSVSIFSRLHTLLRAGTGAHSPNVAPVVHSLSGFEPSVMTWGHKVPHQCHRTIHLTLK